MLGATHDEDVSVYGNVGRRLSRTSAVNFDAYASWYDNDLANFDSVTGEGATLSYSRTFMLERLQLLAALGLYHSDDGTDASTNGSALGRPPVHLLTGAPAGEVLCTPIVTASPDSPSS